jgi:hypothetical protein
MTSFTNRIVEPSVGGSRCAPAAEVVLPKGLGSGQLFPELGGSRRKAAGLDTRLLHTGPRKVQRSFQLAARSFRSTSLGGAKVALRVSGIPSFLPVACFAIVRGPTWLGRKPRLLLFVPEVNHKP